MFRSRFLSVLKVDSLKKTCRMPKITKKMWRAFKHFFGWESYEETLQNFEMSFFATSNNTPMDFCWRRGYRKRWFCKRMFERIPEWLVTPPTNTAPLCWYPCVNYWLNSQILVWGYNFGVTTQLLWSGLRSLRQSWWSYQGGTQCCPANHRQGFGMGRLVVHAESENPGWGYLGMSPFPEIVAHAGLVRDPRAKKCQFLVVTITGKEANPKYIKNIQLSYGFM